MLMNDNVNVIEAKKSKQKTQKTCFNCHKPQVFGYICTCLKTTRRRRRKSFCNSSQNLEPKKPAPKPITRQPVEEVPEVKVQDVKLGQKVK